MPSWIIVSNGPNDRACFLLLLSSRILLHLNTTDSHGLLDLRNRLSGVQALGASLGAVENGVATVQAHRVLQIDLALGGALVTGIDQPAVRLEQDGGAEILLRVPPVRRARR
jgi:hypothetical protein